MSYNVISVPEFRRENFKSNAQFCRAIGVKPQQYKEYENHFVLLEDGEKPFLFIKGKVVYLDTP